MRLLSDSEILKPEVRKAIIEEINSAENMFRKDGAYRRYKAYKDKTSELVLQQLALQFDPDTVREMSYAISNISLARKIVKKLARVYSNGVIRTVKDDPESTKTVQELESILNFNETMKNTNRTLRLQHNTVLYIRPCPTEDGKYWIKTECMQPYLYDVVEGYYDRTKPMVVITSDYDIRRVYSQGQAVTDTASHKTVPGHLTPKSDGKDQMVADPDVVTKEYVWWSNNYHFTTDQTGMIISKPVDQEATGADAVANPIGALPFINFAIDQDGKFWAEGGDDLIDGSVTANSMISQIKHIGVVQGYGQFYVKGKNLPTAVKVGPSKLIRLEWTDKEDPEPSIGFASTTPPLEALMRLVEFEIALLLTTNNLSTSGVKTSLQGGSEFPSGVAMMIDKAESVEDVQDQEQVFKDQEPLAWLLISKWLDRYRDSLVPELQDKILPTEKSDLDVDLKFPPPATIVTEGEKLDNMAKRKELGINTMVDLIMQDNPGMTEEEAEAKLLKIVEESAQKIAKSMLVASPEMEPGLDEPATDGMEPDEGNQDNLDDSEDDV